MLSAARHLYRLGVSGAGLVTWAGRPRLVATALTVAAAPVLRAGRAETERLHLPVRAPTGEIRHTGREGHRRRQPNEDRQGCSAKPTHYFTYRDSSRFSQPVKADPPTQARFDLASELPDLWPPPLGPSGHGPGAPRICLRRPFHGHPCSAAWGVQLRHVSRH